MLSVKYQKLKSLERTVDIEQPVKDYAKSIIQMAHGLNLGESNISCEVNFADVFSKQIKDKMIKSMISDAIKNSMKKAQK